ncbi:NADPH dehydrogenase [subsurface metagenome]
MQSVGRITPNDAGLWREEQVEGLRRVTEFVKSQGALVGVQLAHAGRKASVNAPWVVGRGQRRAGWDVGGWGPGGVVGPTGGVDQIWDGKTEDDESGGYWEPRELTVEEIEKIVDDFRSAAARAVRAGVDVVEIHAAHGYLIHQFLSPVTNRRRDAYGGDFWGRTRLLREVVQAVRSVMPEGLPLFVRVSATEWLEGSEVEKSAGGSWTVDETVRLAKLLPELGVDLLDVSSGSNHRDQDVSVFKIKDYQTRNAARIRREVKSEGKRLLIGAVGLITDAEQARDLVQEEPTVADEAQAVKELTDATGGKEPHADVVFVARQFMREPEWVLRIAAQLDVDVAWPSQFRRVRFPKM